MKLRKRLFGSKTTAEPPKPPPPEGPKLTFHHSKSERDVLERERRGEIDPQLGSWNYAILEDDSHPADGAGLMHSLATLSTNASALLVDDPAIIAAREKMIASLDTNLWRRIAGLLTPADAAALSLTSKTLLSRLSWDFVDALRPPGKEHDRAEFLARLDRWYPSHLLCFPCAKFHRRLQPGNEKYKADYVLNPLFDCPKVHTSRLPRVRLTHGRELPFAFVQLACRARRFSPAYGIDAESLGRRWKCRDSQWSHQSRFAVVKGHLLMRITSTCIVPASLTPTGQRMLLFTREEYEPYFSACAHWRDGELMNICKCAMGHIPPPQRSLRDQVFKDGKGPMALSFSARSLSNIVRGCGDCAPMRRCPDCPSEYLVEIRMVEDRSDPEQPFKHALVVTRWSDLGDGTSPVTSQEWAAVQGQIEYSSFEVVGRRAISGTFEAEVSGATPGARVISLNPKHKKKDEDSDTWY